jgi:hypothetical protein
MVIRCCTGCPVRSTDNTLRSEAWAGKASSAACSVPAPRVASVASLNAKASSITPDFSSASATWAGVPCGTMTACSAGNGPGR